MLEVLVMIGIYYLVKWLLPWAIGAFVLWLVAYVLWEMCGQRRMYRR